MLTPIKKKAHLFKRKWWFLNFKDKDLLLKFRDKDGYTHIRLPDYKFFFLNLNMYINTIKNM